MNKNLLLLTCVLIAIFSVISCDKPEETVTADETVPMEIKNDTTMGAGFVMFSFQNPATAKLMNMARVTSDTLPNPLYFIAVRSDKDSTRLNFMGVNPDHVITFNSPTKPQTPVKKGKTTNSTSTE